MEITRKITAATLSKDVPLKALAAPLYLGRIYGFVRRVETVATQYGDHDKFFGEFVSIRADLEKAASTVCFLPETVAEILAKFIRKHKAEGVKFGFDVYAEPSDKNSGGFIWKVESLMELKAGSSVLDFAESFPPMPIAKETPTESSNADSE